MQSSPVLSLSPSFNTYSSTKLAEIAARVVDEFRAESEFDDIFDFKDDESSCDKAPEQPQLEEVKSNEEDDDDSEFSFSIRQPDSSPISADDIFFNGEIRPTFPIFNTDLLLGDVGMDRSNSSKPPIPRSIRLPLRQLFIEERDTPSCSSSEADELDGIQPGTYCAWTPKSAPEVSSPGKCKKSNSAGSSKRWKFRDLLHRSNSDGKDTFVFLNPPNANAKNRDEEVEKASKVTGNVKEGVAGGGEVASAHSVKNKATKESYRRRSFLPYRQDLVGFFANVNGLSRHVHPF